MNEKLIVLLLCKYRSARTGFCYSAHFCNFSYTASLLPTRVFDCQGKMHLLGQETNECMVNRGLKEKFLVKTLTSKNEIFRIT